MSEPGRFLIYCMEMYRRAKSLTGRQVYDLFVPTGADEYILACYGALHTTGERYIIMDVDEFIAAHSAA